MKLNPKPISFSERTESTRDIAGLNRWAQSSRTVSFIMFILGWFTIPVEVFMRRDFGQRWFTTVNFYAGLFVLIIFSTFQYVWHLLWNAVLSGLAGLFNPDYVASETTFLDTLEDKSMLYILALYILMGSFHRFRIWWRTHTNKALHSYDDGTSRLEPLAGLLIKTINSIALPFIGFYVLLLPKKLSKDTKPPKLINDQTAFTNTVIEPALLLFLAVEFHGITSVWLFISTVALIIYANWKETAKLNKILDFRDSMIEAKVMMELKDNDGKTNTEQVILSQAAETFRDHPTVASSIAEQYPDLMNIIEDMNTSREHLAN